MAPGTTNNLDVVRGTAVLDSGGTLIENVFYWKCDFSAAQTDNDVMTSMASAIDAAYANVDQYMSQYFEFIEIQGFNITQGRPMGVNGWPTCTIGGDVSSQVMANGLCGLVVADTGYSRSRPKKFISGFTEAHAAGNAWDSTIQTALGQFLLDWLVEVTISSGNRLVSGTWSSKYEVFRPILSAIVKAAVAYQRRRKPNS